MTNPKQQSPEMEELLKKYEIDDCLTEHGLKCFIEEISKSFIPRSEVEKLRLSRPRVDIWNSWSREKQREYTEHQIKLNVL